ncbi:MAG: hypothetical protein Kow0077_11060 [Anaerolineae bacterium]
MSSMTTESWAIRQREIFASRRRFFRDVLFRVLAWMFLDLTVTGVENIPASGPVILMINHMTALDPIVVLGTAKPRFVVPMSKIENFQHPLTGLLVRSWGAYPVRRGQVDREALNIAIQLMEAGEMTLIAPEGTRNRALQRPKDGLAFIATRTNAMIVPTAIFNAETWKRDLFIPWRRTPVHVSYGPAFRLRKPESGRVPREVLHQMTDEMMYQLALLLPEHNRGEYSDLSRMTTEYLDFVRQDTPQDTQPQKESVL